MTDRTTPVIILDQKVLALLGDGFPQTAAELSAALGRPLSDVEAALARLGEAGLADAEV